MKYYIGLVISFLTTVVLLGQDQEIINHDIEININYTGKKFYIKENHKYARKILSNRNISASETISFSSLDKLVSFKAKTEVPKGNGKYKVLKVNNSQTVSQDSRGVFYSGREKLMFDYPSSIQNSICKVEYEKDIVDPQFLSSFIIAERYPVKEFTFKLVYPENVEINLDLLNVDHLEVDIKDTVDNHVITKIIYIKNIPEYKFIDKLKSPLYVFPQILTRIKHVKTKKGIIKVSNDLSDLYSWYVSLVDRIPESESHIDLQNQVKDLTSELQAEEEKIKVIYKWVQDHIKYIAFEDGMNGFIPRNANRIYDKRYGDCKDMANLLKTMLSYANIPAYFTWIGTRSKPYSYIDVPSVCTDNHMICSVKINGEYVFLDATNENIRLHVIPQAIQGKEALIGVNDTIYDLVNVPITPMKNNTRVDQMSLKINDKLLIGDISSTLKGYFKDDYDLFSSYKKFRKEKDYYLDLLNIGGEEYTVLSGKHSQNSEETNIKVVSNFENKIIKAGSKLYVNLSLNGFYNQMKVRDLMERQVDIHEDYQFSHQVITQLNIPEGYLLDKMPEFIEYNNDRFGYTKSYKQEEDVLTCVEHVKIDFINLKPSNFESYNQFLESIRKSEKEKIVLIKK